MAKRKSRKNGFDTSALLKYADRLEELGGTDALKRATEAGMAVAKQEINKDITAAMQTSNLPAGGKYSTGDTIQSLDKGMSPAWEGNLATLPLGFDMNESGLTHIFLMHGTPKMKPVAGLKEALYGKTAQRKARKAQEAAIQKVIKRLGG